MRVRAASGLSFAGLWLLSGKAIAQAITEFPIPTPSTQAAGITAGPDGNVWFTEETDGTCGIGPLGGPMTCQVAGGVSRIKPDGTIMVMYSTSSQGNPLSPSLGRGAITAGPDGNLWFTTGSNLVGQITTSGVVTEFASFGSKSITTGPDRNLWITTLDDSIDRITTTGVGTQFALPTSGAELATITAGPDGNLWFTELDANQIGRITTTGVVTEFPVHTPHSGLNGIVAGPDGNLWFTEYLGNQIGRITITGIVTEFPIPTDNSGTNYIAAGADGNLWFTEEAGNRIGRITTAGIITEFTVPTPNALPLQITSGPDGNLWFIGSGFIGRITTSGATCLPDSHTLCLNNGRFAVTADFQSTPEGPSSPATAVPLTADTGYFWFFDPSNIELVTKVLNGCAVNGNFWFFASGLTNVGVQINVTDTVTGATKPYSNTFGTPFQPIQDTSAFPCP